jgi:hypothetical protein
LISFLGLAIFVCCFAGVVAWILGSNAVAFVRSDMDSALAAGLYSAFVGFGLICTLVLFFAALLGFTRIRSTKEATPFQIATLFQVGAGFNRTCRCFCDFVCVCVAANRTGRSGGSDLGVSLNWSAGSTVSGACMVREKRMT